MTFEKALEILKQGGRVYREGWNGKGMELMIIFPWDTSDMTRRYIAMVIHPNSTKQFEGKLNEGIEMVPWLPSQTDLMAEDWVEKSYGDINGAENNGADGSKKKEDGKDKGTGKA